jgi:uncharacterized glyoxalase superfamily protein PhnB
MIVPIFGCENTESATKFYVEALGFEVLARFQMSEDAKDPSYVTLAINGSHLHMSSFPTAQGTGKMAYVYMDQPAAVDALYETVKDRSDIDINVPLVDQTWGLREFGFTDPFGNKLTFGAELPKS